MGGVMSAPVVGWRAISPDGKHELDENDMELAKSGLYR